MPAKSAMEPAVKIGTTFRRPIADGNPLWEVVSIQGDHADIVCVNEPIMINGTSYDSDYAGTRSSELLSEIRRRMNAAAFFERAIKAGVDFWASQEVGTVLHYHDSFGRFVRGVVVLDEDGKKAMRPTAMVGEWREFDVVRRTPSGDLQYGYHARRIMDGSTFAPNASNIFESPEFRRTPKHGDPRTMTPMSLELPEPTPQEKIQQMQERMAETVIGTLQDRTVPVGDRLAAALDLLRDAV